MDSPSTASAPIWGDLAERVFASLGGAANSSPTIVRTLEYGSRYATIDHSAGEIVFDLRALYLGLLAAGSVDLGATTLGNSAAWLSVWLAEKVGGQSAIIRALEQHGQKDDPLMAMRQGLTVLSSRSLKALLPKASAYAQATVSRPRFDMRHLLAAMINGGVVGEMTSTATEPPNPLIRYSARKRRRPSDCSRIGPRINSENMLNAIWKSDPCECTNIAVIMRHGWMPVNGG